MAVRILPTSIGYPDTPEEVLSKPRLAKILRLAIPVVARKLERLGITDETIYYEWGGKGDKNLAEYYSLSQFPYNSKKIDALIKKGTKDLTFICTATSACMRFIENNRVKEIRSASYPRSKIITEI